MEEEFRTVLDIKNRALQHVGATRIATEAEDSKNAAAVNFAYDKVRKAELRRNVWRFAIRRAVLRPIDTTTMVVKPPLWDAARAYQPGAVVADANRTLWISTRAFNFNHTPGTDDCWMVYFGPLTADAYGEITTGYSTGEFVYENTAPGAPSIFSALVDTTSTSTDPFTATVWDADTTFAKGQVVDYLGFYFMSLIDLNVGNTPDEFDTFDAGTTYDQNDLVAAVDGFVYISVVGTNLDNEPTTDNGSHWLKNGTIVRWTPSFIGSTSGTEWRGHPEATIISPNIIYPVGSGPSSNAATRNVFMLPNGFLRRAVQNPDAGRGSRLGAFKGAPEEDWDLEGNYIVSESDDMIILRFAADITNVPQMDGMFCEGLALRLATDICEELTQSADKKKAIAAMYVKHMGEARTVNGIETGPTEPAEDEFISVRR